MDNSKEGTEKREKTRLVEANIKLQDENKWLKLDNERLKLIFNEIKEYIETNTELEKEIIKDILDKAL